MAIGAQGGNSLNRGANPDADIWSSLSEEPEQPQQPQQLEQQGIDNGSNGLTEIEQRLGLSEPYIFESQLRNTELTTEERRDLNETRREQFGIVRDAYQEAMQKGDIPRDTQFGNFKTYLENNIRREYSNREKAEQAAKEQEIAELLNGRTPEEAKEWLRSEINKYQEEIGYLNQEMSDMQTRYESHTNDALQANLAEEAPTKRYEDQINYDQSRIAELQQRLDRISALGLSGNGENGGNQPGSEAGNGNVAGGQPQGENVEADTSANQPQGENINAHAGVDGAQNENGLQGENQTPGADRTEGEAQAQNGGTTQNENEPDRPIDYSIRSQDMGLFPDGHEPEDVAAAWGNAMAERNGNNQPGDETANGNAAGGQPQGENVEAEANDAERENNIEGRAIRNEDGSYNEDYLNSDHYQAERRAEDKFDRVDASLTRAVEEHRMHPGWAEQLRERALREFSIEVDNIRQAYLNGEDYARTNPENEAAAGAGENTTGQNDGNAGPQNGNPNGRVNFDIRSQDMGLFPDGHEPRNENANGNGEEYGVENNNTENNGGENEPGAENTPEREWSTPEQLNEEEKALQAELAETQAELQRIRDAQMGDANFTVIEADFDAVVDQLANAKAGEMRDAKAKSMKVLGGIWNFFLGNRYEKKMAREIRSGQRGFAINETGAELSVDQWLGVHKNDVIKRMLEAATDSRFLMTDEGESISVDQDSSTRMILDECFEWISNAKVPEDGPDEATLMRRFKGMVNERMRGAREAGLDVPDFMKTNVDEVAGNIRKAVNHKVGMNDIRQRFNIYYADVRDATATVDSILETLEVNDDVDGEFELHGFAIPAFDDYRREADERHADGTSIYDIANRHYQKAIEDSRDILGPEGTSFLSGRGLFNGESNDSITNWFNNLSERARDLVNQSNNLVDGGGDFASAEDFLARYNAMDDEGKRNFAEEMRNIEDNEFQDWYSNLGEDARQRVSEIYEFMNHTAANLPINDRMDDWLEDTLS